MRIKKFVATGLAALMAGATLAGAALAATQLGNVLHTIGQQAVSGTPYLVVVGSKAAPSDVVGAIDVASALAQQMYTKETIAGTTTTTIEGKEATNIHFDSDTLSSVFGSELTKTQVPFLLREKMTYNNTDYYVEEKIVVPSVEVKTDASTLNGTTYVDFESGQPEYKYVFDDDIYTPSFGTSDAYSHPLLVKIMGKPYYIINTPAQNQITIMSGTVGMADASTPVTYNGYKVYVTDGADGSWAKIQIKDSNGNVVKTDILNQGETADYSDLGFKVKVLNVWASTVSNTVTAKLVVGSELDKTITSGDDFAPYWKWDINIQNPGNITKGDYIGVVYAPNDTATKYLALGSTLKAPNDYFEIGYPKNVIDQFAKITVEPSTATIYSDAISTSALLNGAPALIISSSYPVFGNGEYSKVAIVVNTTNNNDTAYLAYYDDSASKYVVESSNKFAINPANDTIGWSGSFDQTQISFAYKNGTLEFDISKTGYTTPDKIIANYVYSDDSKSFSLGTKNQADDSDISVGGAWTDSAVTGTWDHNAVSPYGVVLYNPKSNAESDKVVFDVPADQQTADIYIGKATTTTTAGTTYNKIVPLTTTVAKLDSEVTQADKTNDNLVLVGGPCVNTLVADLAASGKFPYTCSNWPGRNFGIIKVIDNAFASGKLALVVAGTRAEDTRLATSVLALGKLAGQTASEVEVTGTVSSPVITPVTGNQTA